MEVVKVKIEDEKERYFVADDNGIPIEPILLTLRHQNNKTIEITYLKGILMVYFCTLILNLLIN